MRREDKDTSFKARGDSRVTTDWRTICFLLLTTATAITAWNDIKRQQQEDMREIKVLCGQVLFTDELDRYGTILDRKNRVLNLVLPSPDDYLRRGRAISDGGKTNGGSLAMKAVSKGISQ